MAFEKIPSQSSVEQLVTECIEEVRRLNEPDELTRLLEPPEEPEPKIISKDERNMFGIGDVKVHTVVNLRGWWHIKDQDHKYAYTAARLVHSEVEHHRLFKQPVVSVQFAIDVFKTSAGREEDEDLGTFFFDPNSDLPPDGLIIQALNYHLQELKHLKYEQGLEAVEQKAIRICRALYFIDLSLSELERNMAGVTDKKSEAKSNLLNQRQKLLGEAALFAANNTDLLTELATREDNQRFIDKAAEAIEQRRQELIANGITDPEELKPILHRLYQDLEDPRPDLG